MTAKLRSVLVLILASLALVRPVVAQEAATGLISGTVLAAATDAPIEGAQVTLVGTALRAVADARGRFVITGVAPGIWRLQVRAIGYAPLIIPDIVVGSAKPAVVVVRLAPLATDLGAVAVTASYFLPSLSATTSTQSFTSEAIRRAPGVQEDVVRAVALFPGVGVTQPGRNDLVVRGGAPFENLFLVDGIEVPNINHFGSQGSTGGPL